MKWSGFVRAVCFSAFLATCSAAPSAAQGPAYAEFRMGDVTMAPGQAEIEIPLSLVIHGGPSPAEVTQWSLFLDCDFTLFDRVWMESGWGWDSFVTLNDCSEPGQVSARASALSGGGFPSGGIAAYLKACVRDGAIFFPGRDLFELAHDSDCELWPNDTLVHAKGAGWLNATLKGGDLTIAGDPVERVPCGGPPPRVPPAAFRFGDVTAASGGADVRMPLYLSADGEVESFAVEIEYDPDVVGNAAVEDACGWEIHFFGPDQFAAPGIVAFRAYSSPTTDERLAANGGIAAYLKFCVLGTAPSGDHLIRFVDRPSHWRDIWTQCITERERCHDPSLTAGRLTVSGDPVPGGDCPRDPEIVETFQSRWPWIRLGKATAAPGEAEVRLPIAIDAGAAAVERWDLKVRYDTDLIGNVTVENACDWEMSTFGVDAYWVPGVIDIVAGATRATARKMDASGGIAAYLKFCVRDTASPGEHGFFECDYIMGRPLILDSGIQTELIAAGRSFEQGSLTIAGDPVPGGDCPRDPPPAPPPSGLYRLDGGTAMRGEEVAVPFIARADRRPIGEVKFSIRYDGAVLEPIGIEKVYRRPDGKDYYTELYCSPVTKGPWGYDWLLDEGFIVGRADFIAQEGFDPDIPEAGGEHTVLNLRFRVKPDAGFGETTLEFVDGGSVRAFDGDDWITFTFKNSMNGWMANTSFEVSPVTVEARLMIAGDGVAFVRGDANGDERVDISDIIFTLVFLFMSAVQPDCMEALDSDGGGTVGIGDAIFMLNYLFLLGGKPGRPFPECGIDFASDALPCDSFPPCR